MALFRYEAADRTGRVLHGAMNARDEAQVADNLVKMGYSVRSIQSTSPVQTTVAPNVRAQPQPAAPVTPISVRPIVPLASLSMFFRQIATLLKSGIPINQALADTSVYTRQRHLRSAIPAMSQAVQSGASLSSAMAAHPGIFPVWATARVWAGELAGEIEIAFEEIADDLEAEAKDARYGSIWWVITKLTVVLSILILPFCDVSKLLSSIFSAEKVDALAIYKAILIETVIKWAPLAAGLSVIFLAWTALKRVPAVRSALDTILLRVPIWGGLHKYRSLAAFLHTLDRLYSAGLSPAIAWDAASLTVRNNAVAQALRSSGRTASESPVQKIVTSGIFDSDDIGMASAGERAGRLPEAFAQLSRIYQDRATQQKTIGRLWSVSAFISFQIAVSGIGIIVLAYSYYQKFLFGTGLGF